MASGVIFSELTTIATAMPGASLSKRGLVASGVTSRGENPVPPVVRINGKWRRSHQSNRTSWGNKLKLIILWCTHCKNHSIFTDLDALHIIRNTFCHHIGTLKMQAMRGEI